MIGNLACCGVKEMQNIARHRTPEAILQAFCENRFAIQTDDSYIGPVGNGKLRAAHFLFTQAGEGPRNHYGYDLEYYIRENNLGLVMRTEPKRNPNSRRMLVAFIWTPDEKRLKTWWKQHPMTPVVTVYGG